MDASKLRQHVRAILDFYAPVVKSDEAGGFNNQLLDDGSVYDSETRHVVGTCRFVVNYAMAAEIFPEAREQHLEMVQHGLAFLFTHQRDLQRGGFYWVVKAHCRLDWGGTYQYVVHDSSKYCYAAAFALLALGSAKRAGVREVRMSSAAREAIRWRGDTAPEAPVPVQHLIDEVFAETVSHFFEPQHGNLCIDCFDEQWREIVPGAAASVDKTTSAVTGGGCSAAGYRGQNANMHMAEAMLCLHEAAQDDGCVPAGAEARATSYLDLALGICRRLCHELRPSRAPGAPPGVVDGVWEHFGSDWKIDWTRNKDAAEDSEEHIFRPWGLQPGHCFEWTKLALLIERALTRVGRHPEHREAWLIPRAEELWRVAVQHGWDYDSTDGGGACYTFRCGGGGAVDARRYYWVHAEMLAASALLGARTGKPEYWEWYDTVWAFCLQNFVDSARGGWYPVLDASNRRTDPHLPAKMQNAGYAAVKSYPSKTDYHPLAACYEILQVIACRSCASGPMTD